MLFSSRYPWKLRQVACKLFLQKNSGKFYLNGRTVLLSPHFDYAGFSWMPFLRGCGGNLGDSVLAGLSSKAKMKEMCMCRDRYCSGLIQLKFPNPAL